MRTIIESIDERNSFLKAHKGTDREKRHTISAAARSKKNPSLVSLASIALMFISSLAAFLVRGWSPQRTEPPGGVRSLVVHHFHLQRKKEAAYDVTFLPPPALLNLLPKQVNIHSHLGEACDHNSSPEHLEPGGSVALCS